MAPALTIIGLAMVLLAVQDVFLTLFHPAGRGAMSDYVARIVWRAFRRVSRRHPRAITFAGPVAFVGIIATWAALVVFGCSLVYFPYIGSAFAVAPGMDPYSHRHYIDAFNVSLGALISLGADFNSNASWLRLLMGIEAVIGFGLLTADVSWLLSIYPVLEQRRSVAQMATLLHHAQLETGNDPTLLPAGEAQTVLNSLTVGLLTLRNQIAQFPITYYFHMGEKQTALAGILGYMADLAERAASPGRPPAVRLAGTTLGGAVDDFLVDLARTYLRMPCDDKQAVMRAYAEDQMRELVSDGGLRRVA